ncbi:DUF1919 domain-containing protein [Mariniflexile sp. AS56]|uniref:DUF1919 domain-containing protein n=1 Tax=Mariniflexile sp. AS56 TaxID=3063957 RepID=UPI0026F0898D|nr:DUF1919 domain-containing protein [Mariniflexile sp. AS56]MDO7173359.1 DUF1919 domain-containing protein [Mariniflexile sp. AS56]
MLRNIYNHRNKISKNLSKRLIKDKFTIISDDCWGGQIYNQLEIPYYTPTVGLWIGGHDYIQFIENLSKANAANLYNANSNETYPVGQSAYAKFHFLHYKNFDIAVNTFQRRYQRINWNKLLYKIDLEKPGMNADHIKKWNEMKLPNSIAFYSDRVLKEWSGDIHNGVYIKNWVLDGALMFDISRRSFNVFKWLNTGVINKSLIYAMMNFLLFDPTTDRKILYKIRKLRTKIARIF